MLVQNYRVWNKEKRAFIVFSAMYFDVTGNIVSVVDVDGYKIPGYVGQYISQNTGILDKNKKSIYVADILWAYEKTWKVVFSEGAFMAFRIGQCRALRMMHCEVIGNIYENPELMYKERGAHA